MRFRVLLGVNLALHSLLVIACIYALLKLRTKAKAINWPPVIEGQGLRACYTDQLWSIWNIIIYGGTCIGLCLVAYFSDLNKWGNFLTNMFFSMTRYFFLYLILTKYAINEFI